MRVAAMLSVVVFVAMSGATGVGGPSAYKALYDAHRWPELRDAVMHAENVPPLYRGAVAAAFNDRPRADAILRQLIHSPGGSLEDVNEAYNILAHMLLDAGQYQQFNATLKEKWHAFPDKAGEELKDYGAFLHLPDQKVETSRPSVLPVSESVWVPVTINTLPAEYFLDTGAVPAMSESEAKRLGMTILDTDGTTGTSTGQRVGFRTAVARQLTVGGTKFTDVSFLVFPDDQQPWANLPPTRRGLLGVPVLLGLHRLKWSRDKTVEVGGASGPHEIATSNLWFDDDHLVALGWFHNHRISLTLDTGAETTDLYGKFASEFSSLLDNSGRRSSQRVEGISNTQEFDAIKLPQVFLRFGTFAAILKPANVILKQLGQPWSYGNLGLDVLKQADSFVIDFGAMTLQMERVPASRGQTNRPRQTTQ